MAIKEYDLIAIGGGTAGLVSGAGAAFLGLNAAIVEKEALGGDCLWTGCVPSKALIASAKVAHIMEKAPEWGLTGASPGHAFREVMERMRRVQGVVAHHDDPERFRKMGVDIQFGSARFLDARTVEVEGAGALRSKRIVIATGAAAAVPPIPGLEEAGYLTNHSAFEQNTLPSRIVILGAGPIGLEFAQIYRRLGADVTVVERGGQIMPKEDPDVAQYMQEVLEAEGITFKVGSSASSVERETQGGETKVVVTESGDRIICDEIFVATGRRPVTEGLDLERAGVATERGAVKVDATLRTSQKSVWAAGDVTGGLQFTHVADYMAKAVLQNSIFPIKKKVDYGNVPWVTFTDPEVAHVGLSTAEAEAQGAQVYSYQFSDLDRAIADGESHGFVKISADKKGRVLGATIVGTAAGELIFPLVLARQEGIPLSKISGTIFPYPTKTEGVKRAADEFQRARLAGSSGKILKKVISWLK